MLHAGKCVTEVALKIKVTLDALDQPTTSGAAPIIDGKVFRSGCHNAVVVSLMLLEHSDDKRLLHVMTCPCMPLNEFHSYQNTECRSVGDSRSLAAKIVNGGFFIVFTDIMKALKDPQVMDECSFGVTGNDMTLLVVPHAQFMYAEDEWAPLLADSCMALVAARRRRTLGFCISAFCWCFELW